jgi:hypothetical protein
MFMRLIVERGKVVYEAKHAGVDRKPEAIFLTDFAVRYRYPGWRATKAQAKQALKDCREVRRVIRTAFGLSV